MRSPPRCSRSIPSPRDLVEVGWGSYDGAFVQCLESKEFRREIQGKEVRFEVYRPVVLGVVRVVEDPDLLDVVLSEGLE